MACIVTVVGESDRTGKAARPKSQTESGRVLAFGPGAAGLALVDAARSARETAPEIAGGLHRLMGELAIDKEAVAEMAPALMRNLETGCMGCKARGACQSAFAERTIVETYPEFCPNTKVLDALRS